MRDSNDTTVYLLKAKYREVIWVVLLNYLANYIPIWANNKQLTCSNRFFCLEAFLMSCPNCFKTKSFVQATWTSISFVLGNLVLLFPGNLSLMLSSKSFLLEHYVLLAQQPWFHVCGHLKCVSIVVFPISDLEESREWQPTSPFGRHVACSLWSSDAERLLASGQDTQTQLRPIERSVREGHQKPLSDSQLWLICWGSQCATVQSQRHRKVILIFFSEKKSFVLSNSLQRNC